MSTSINFSRTIRISFFAGILIGLQLFNAGCKRTPGPTAILVPKDSGNLGENVDAYVDSDAGKGLSGSYASSLLSDSEACKLLLDNWRELNDLRSLSLPEVFKVMRLPLERLTKSRIDGINFSRADAVSFSKNCELVITTGGFGGLSGILSADARVMRVELVKNGSAIFPCRKVDLCCGTATDGGLTP